MKNTPNYKIYIDEELNAIVEGIITDKLKLMVARGEKNYKIYTDEELNAIVEEELTAIVEGIIIDKQ